MPSIHVLPEHEQRLDDAAVRLEFLDWLRDSVDASGPAISLLTETENGREAVAALVRPHYRLIRTFTQEAPGAA